MSVCTCIAQDRAHLLQVTSRRPIVHCPLEHWLLFGALLWGVTLSLGMADGASSAVDSPGDDSNLNQCTATRYRKRLDDDSDLSHTRAYSYRTQEAARWRQRLKPYACVQLPDTGSGQTTTATWVVRVQLPDTGSAAQARLQHRGKNDWQPNGIFLSLYFFIFILFFMFISISF